MCTACVGVLYVCVWGAGGGVFLFYPLLSSPPLSPTLQNAKCKAHNTHTQTKRTKKTSTKRLRIEQLFVRARRSASCPWQVYAAAARMEWRLGREKEVARKIFEKGLEAAAATTAAGSAGGAGGAVMGAGGASPCLLEPRYIAAYADFLCGESSLTLTCFPFLSFLLGGESE